MTNTECVFCDMEIINKQKYFSTNLFYVLVVSGQLNTGHSLIVPKRHDNKLSQLTDAEIIEMKNLLQKLEQGFFSLGYDGFNLISNTAAVSGQTVSRAHTHFIPRKQNDTQNDFKNLSFPSEKERHKFTDKDFEKRTQELSKLFKL